ncbi:hypothetical protein BD413DRAFT_213315 [Trametes elegans]|nr:hypothetical protein BD413DRAFT_213315 [Trametes elegans]
MPLFGKHKHDARHDPALRENDAVGQPGYGAGAAPGAHDYGTHPHQAGYGPAGTGPGAPADPYTHQSGVGAGAGAGSAGAQPGVPPARHINTDNTHTAGGGARLAGKAERAAGTLVGSQALKERGFQKEQEAGAFKMQSAEIAEAERLEKEALMRRERAVAHGAHPDNRHLGGLQNANTLSDVTGGQAGQPTLGSGGARGY